MSYWTLPEEVKWWIMFNLSGDANLSLPCSSSSTFYERPECEALSVNYVQCITANRGKEPTETNRSANADVFLVKPMKAAIRQTRCRDHMIWLGVLFSLHLVEGQYMLPLPCPQPGTVGGHIRGGHR